MARKAKKTYDESTIKVLKGLEGVRKRPEMYIGPVDGHGIFTILREVMDNSVDEFLANNRYDAMTVQVYKDGYFVVHDNGQGIPVGKHPTEGVSTLQVVMSELHAGGKLDETDSVYEASRGTHGVGVSVTNALSEHFVAYTCRKSTWYAIEFEQGELIHEVEEIDLDDMEVENLYDRGTIIMFKPDASVFNKGAKLQPKHIHEWADITAYLSAGFSVTVDIEGKDEVEYVHEGGVKDWSEHTLEQLKCNELTKKHITVSDKNLDINLTFTDAEKANLYAYCNGLQQVDGGTHVSTVTKALVQSLKPYQGKTQKFGSDEVMDGVVGIINFKINEPKFSSQTKEKLVDARFDELCKPLLEESFDKYWKANKSLAREICKRANDLKSIKTDFSALRKSTTAIRKIANDSSKLPSKLIKVAGIPDDARELYIVEGDSAKGTSDSARMEKPFRFQEVLCLKGKSANAYKINRNKLMANESILSVFASIGTHLKDLRVGKIILLSDPDPDGYHIDSLLLSLFAVIIPQVYAREMVYIVETPKFMLNNNGTQYFAMTREEIYAKIPKGVNRDKITYMKGWGEATPSAMREIAFDPETRRLHQVNKPSRKQYEHLSSLMGDDVTFRKELLGID